MTETLNRLLSQGLVARSGKTQSRNGRPSATYAFGEKAGYSVGISVDADGFRLIALDARHRMLKEHEGTLSLSPDPTSHFEEILAQVSAELRRFLASAELRKGRAMAIGIAPPGMVDTEKGIWLNGLRVSGITRVALGDLLEKMFGVTIVVEDTARCLAYLHASRRQPEKSRDLVYLRLGNGVGAGIMIGPDPYHGSHGLAGEIGHLQVEEEGARCSCGNIGCLETVVSSSNIIQRFQRRLSEGVISTLQNYRGDHALTLEVIRDAANAGDRLAQTTLFELGMFLGDAISKIIKLFNPRTLVIGGPVAVLGEHLLAPIWIKVRQKVSAEMLADFEMEIALPQPHEEAEGAACLAERRFWKDANPRGISAE